jgi:lipid-A-disaccharide synthase
MANAPLRLALVAGEESGDQLGAGLMAALLRKAPSAIFVGLGGERMAARGMQSFFPIEEVAVMGLGSVVRHLPRIFRRISETVERVLASRPDALVIIDSPELTHAVARRVAKRRPELPIVDYVSPSVWAWRPGRARSMRRYIDHVLALLPFEPEVHRRLGGPACTYVGHPLIERLSELVPAEGERPGLGSPPLLLVLPGSRHTEIARLIEPFGQALGLIAAARPDVEVLLPAVGHLRDEIETRVAGWPLRPRLLHGEAEKFSAFRRAHAALAASGTVTLELGLAGVPMVVAYRIDPVARLLKPFLRIPSIVLPNLILGENAVPEFLDADSSPDVLARETLALLLEGPARTAQSAALARLHSLMTLPGGERPSDRAAAIVLEAAENGAGRRQALLERRAETGR